MVTSRIVLEIAMNRLTVTRAVILVLSWVSCVPVLAVGDEQWVPFADCLFEGPEFDSQEALNYFEKLGAVLTREDFRRGPNAYTEENGVLTINGTDNTSNIFGMDLRNGLQRVTAYFNPESLQTGFGSVGLMMSNEGPDERSMAVTIFNTDFEGFTIGTSIFYEDVIYPLSEPIPYSNEAVRMTKDTDGFITIELDSGYGWYPVVATNILAGIPCRAVATCFFVTSSWKPQMTGLIFERPRLSCDLDGNGQINALDIQETINSALGCYLDPLHGDVNWDWTVDAVDVQFVINPCWA